MRFRMRAARARTRPWRRACKARSSSSPAHSASSPAPAPLAAEPLVYGGVDLTKGDAALGAMQQARDAAGRIDALLNIAGGFTWRTLEESDCALWDMMYALNLKTAVNASKAAIPHL